MSHLSTGPSSVTWTSATCRGLPSGDECIANNVRQTSLPGFSVTGRGGYCVDAGGGGTHRSPKRLDVALQPFPRGSSLREMYDRCLYHLSPAPYRSMIHP